MRLKVLPDLVKSIGNYMQRSSVELLPEETKAELNKRLVQSAFSGYESLADWLEEKGYKISKSSVHRYGSKLQEQMESIAQTTEAAKYLIESIPDDEGSVNEALLRLATDKLFKFFRDTDLTEPKDIANLVRSVGDITRGSISSKKYRAEVKAKSEVTAKEVEDKVRSAGLDESTAAEIRQKILGIAA
jgi:hypothetical protein